MIPRSLDTAPKMPTLQAALAPVHVLAAGYVFTATVETVRSGEWAERMMDATRLDIAARVDGRAADIPLMRGQDVSAGAVLVRIGNPETVAKLQQARAARAVAQRNVEPGEYVSPGAPLFALVAPNDTWIHFDLREDRNCDRA
jgi:multidrug resistance efflux pump